MWLGFVFIACGTGGPDLASSTSDSPGKPQLFGPAEAVAAADLNGDGFDEEILVRSGVVHWSGGEEAIDCTVQVTSRRTVGTGGREEALLGCGAGRETRYAPARILAVGEKGISTLWSRDGERNQFSDLRVLNNEIWVAVFSSKFQVEAGWIREGAFEVVSEGRLATQQYPLAGGQVLQGRVYGEAPRSPGDLRVVGSKKVRVLPTWRGVRSLQVADLNEDSRPELLVGDGWHYAYAEQARARLLLLEGPDWEVGRTMAFFPDDYSVRSIQVLEEGVLAVGTRHAHWLIRDELGWSSTTIAELSETDLATVMTTREGPGVLVSGSPARWVPIP
ncbi:MAG: hypothetical protein VX519_08370 [Myxococcota bacterium]|nr:hypothetical protein [Myxococcota bacterium]